MTEDTHAPECPLCLAPWRLVEVIGHGWYYCGCCAKSFLLDTAGRLVRTAETNHDPQTPRV